MNSARSRCTVVCLPQFWFIGRSQAKPHAQTTRNLIWSSFKENKYFETARFLVQCMYECT
jgi:hypothetical protein